MPEDFLTRATHNEFAGRMEAENARLADENKRQNKRIENLEEENRQIQNLALSVQELASSVKAIAKETERLGNRIDESIKKLEERISKLEGRDGERWRTLVGYFITACAGLLFGLLVKQLGL